MTTRKFESDYSRIQKKRRIETLIAWQKGDMNKKEQMFLYCRYFIFEKKMLKTWKIFKTW